MQQRHPPIPLTVVVPTLNERETLPGLLASLRDGLDVEHEVVVADGRSDDGTARIAESHGVSVTTADGGRGAQLAWAVRQTSGSAFWFVHADARPDARTLAQVSALASAPLDAAWAARLAIDAGGAAYRVIAAGANLRSRIAGLPYGDQGLLVSRAHYAAAGGYPPWPLMEDVGLVRALRRAGVPVRLLDGTMTVAARRWQRDGVVRRTLGNWRLLARFLAGADPEALARRYR